MIVGRFANVNSPAATPRPLRLPSLALQSRNASTTSLRSDPTPHSSKLQPGQPTQKSGLLLGYNRNLHDQQRMQVAHLQQPSSAGSSPLPSPITGSTPSVSSPRSVSSSMSRIGRPSMPNTSSTSASGMAPPTAFRRPSVPVTTSISRPTSESGDENLKQQPRTGTGMAYRKSSASLNSRLSREHAARSAVAF